MPATTKIDGYKKTDFQHALKAWDRMGKDIKLVYRRQEFHFQQEYGRRTEFIVHAGMIIEGEWFVEEGVSSE